MIDPEHFLVEHVFEETRDLCAILLMRVHIHFTVVQRVECICTQRMHRDKIAVHTVMTRCASFDFTLKDFLFSWKSVHGLPCETMKFGM